MRTENQPRKGLVFVLGRGLAARLFNIDLIAPAYAWWMEPYPLAKKIGHGDFGDIYSGIVGDEAIQFLLSVRSGEVRAAFHRPDIGDIDLIWGQGGADGYGLAKIVEKHPEAIFLLSRSVEGGVVVKELPDRKIIVFYENGQKSVIDLRYKEKAKTWLVTSYIPRAVK
jgi:hypothetical protein